jgi:hypothetical protein
MKRFFVFLGVVLATIGSAVRAQEADSMAQLQKSSWGDAKTMDVNEYIPDVSVHARMGYEHDFLEQVGRFDSNGLYLGIDGKISPNFSYSFYHCIATDDGGDFFTNTNWLTVTYENDFMAIKAGKDNVLVGSFEYDAYDVDSYWFMNSSFWNAFDSWQWGASASFYPADDHELTIQACNSPFSFGEPNLFAYALCWRGEMDFFESYWTANLWQYDTGSYMKSVNLGNRFSFDDFSVDLEYMTRATDLKNLFTQDFTLMAAPSYEFADWGRVTGKFGWEKCGEDALMGYGYDGSYMFYGLAAEFFPIEDYEDLRVHASWGHGCNRPHVFNIGVTWKFSLTDTVKKIVSTCRNR